MPACPERLRDVAPQRFGHLDPLGAVEAFKLVEQLLGMGRKIRLERRGAFRRKLRGSFHPGRILVLGGRLLHEPAPIDARDDIEWRGFDLGVVALEQRIECGLDAAVELTEPRLRRCAVDEIAELERVR